MSCQEFVELVTAYLEGEMDADTRRRFEEHLDLCPGCVTYLDQFRETIDLLGELPEESLSAEATNRLLAAFRGWKKDA